MLSDGNDIVISRIAGYISALILSNNRRLSIAHRRY